MEELYKTIGNREALPISETRGLPQNPLSLRQVKLASCHSQLMFVIGAYLHDFNMNLRKIELGLLAIHFAISLSRTNNKF